MKTYNCREINLSYSHMRHLRDSNDLHLGIDNTDATKYVIEGLVKNKGVWAASTFYSWIAIGIFIYSIYLSYTIQWWIFIPGFFLMRIVWNATKQTNADYVIDDAMTNSRLYHRVKDDGNWLYYLHEEKAYAHLIEDLTENDKKIYNYWCGIYDGTINLNNGCKFNPLNFYNPNKLDYSIDLIFDVLVAYFLHHKKRNTYELDGVSISSFKNSLLISIISLTHFIENVEDIFIADDIEVTENMNMEDKIDYFASKSDEHMKLLKELTDKSIKKTKILTEKFNQLITE